MQCPHCRGEIPRGSRFCGVCGRSVTLPPVRPGRVSPEQAADAAASPSLFELPVSRGARVARLFVVLALDIVLIGAGIAMAVSYWNARREAGAADSDEPDPPAEARIEALPPRPVIPDEASGTEDGSRGVDEEASGRGVEQPVSVRADTGSASSTSGGDAARAPGSAPGSGRSDPPDRPGSSDSTPGNAASSAPPEGGEGSGSPSGEGSGHSTEESSDQSPSGDAGPTVDGGAIDADVKRLARQVGLAVGRQRQALRRCYEQAAKVTTPAEPLQGRIEVRFTVMPDGKTANVREFKNTSGSEQLADCLVGVVSGLSFPAGVREPAEFVWPFVFEAPK